MGILASVAVVAVLVGAAVLIVMGSTAATPLAIQDPAFQTQIDNDCSTTNVEITAVNGQQLTVGGLEVDAVTGKGPSVNLGSLGTATTTMFLFCNGARHTWIGTLTYAGYTFSSDATHPLQFTVDRKTGYLYVGGKGTATFPDGHVVTLGG